MLAVFAAVASVSVGLIVWRGERGSRYKRSFAILSTFVCLWILSNVLFAIIHNDGFQYAMALISYAVAMMLAAELLAFCVNFIHHHIPYRHVLLIILPGIIAALLSMVPGLIAYDVHQQVIMTHMASLIVYGVILLSYLIAACVVLLVARRSLASRMRQRVDTMLVGMVASVVIGAFCNLFLPLAGIYGFIVLGPASAVLFIGSIAYAIVRHGLFDVRLTVVRSVTYFLVLTTMVGVYFGIAFLLSGLLRNSFGDPLQTTLSIGTALVLALIFQPVKRFFDHWTNRIFYRENYSTDDFLARVGQVLSTANDLHDLLQKASKEIGSTLQAEQCFFYVRAEGRRLVTTGMSNHSQLKSQEVAHLDAYVSEYDLDVIAVNLLHESDEILSIFARHKIAIALPLFYGEGAKSYLFLGERRSRQYTQRDIRVLETISDELLIAIQNMLSIQEVKDINATLNQRIDDATKELRASNAQLQRLDAAKDEFVSMASHQLRTPLTSVKGYLSMVLEGDVGKVTSAQQKVLNEAFISSERMVHLINDFLNVSRIQTGKFILERRAVDLAKMVNQEVDSLQTTARVHELKLKYRPPSHFPILYVDENKLRQVLMNFIDNAIYYSHEGTTIDVKLEIVGGDAILTVHDTGIGVPKSEQAHLFSKFFRATNARKQRPDGTGVGLFLAKKVIDAHGGSMVFESVEGEGSTFGFRLPIKKLSAAPDDDANQLDK